MGATEELTAEELEVENEEVENGEDEQTKSTETGEQETSTPEGEDQVDLKARLDELETANAGLIKSLSSQRGIRQDLQAQLDDIRAAINEAKGETNTASETPQPDLSKIPVEFDTEGEMYIDPKYLQNTTNPVVAGLQEELNTIKQSIDQYRGQQYEAQQLNNLLNERDGYAEAYKQVSEAWKYMKDEVFDSFIARKGIAPPQTTDAAIDLVMGSQELQDIFAKKYPNVDLESTLEAHLIATPRYMRKALNKALTNPGNTNEQLDLSRPSSLANANSGPANTPEALLEKVSDMSMEDYEKLDASTLDKIDKLLAKQG